MTGGTVGAELLAAAAAVFAGVRITLVYDFLRIFRRAVSHSALWIGLEDGVFWIWTSFWIFSVLYRINDGAFRVYTMAAMLLGMLGYLRLISEPLVRGAGAFLKRVLDVLGIPVKKLKIYIIILGNKLKKILKRSIMKCRQNRQAADFGGMSDDKDGT